MFIDYCPNSPARKGGGEEVQTEYGGTWGEEEENDDYRGMVQPSQQHVVPCVKRVKWGLGTRGLGMVAAFDPAPRIPSSARL